MTTDVSNVVGTSDELSQSKDTDNEDNVKVNYTQSPVETRDEGEEKFSSSKGKRNRKRIPTPNFPRFRFGKSGKSPPHKHLQEETPSFEENGQEISKETKTRQLNISSVEEKLAATNGGAQQRLSNMQRLRNFGVRARRSLVNLTTCIGRRTRENQENTNTTMRKTIDIDTLTSVVNENAEIPNGLDSTLEEEI